MMAHQEGGPQVRSSIDRTMQHIEKLVERETEALQSRAPFDLRESNNRKSRALLELDLAARSMQGVPLDSHLVERLKGLRGKLEENRAALNRHLEAVREIAKLVADTIQDADWDGTYSQHAGSGGEHR